MKLDQVRPVFDAEGPFTTVRCDVSRHTEHSAHDIEVRWESLVKELDAEGAPPEDVAAAGDRLLADTHAVGSWERTVVVCGGEVLMDDLRPARQEDLAVATHGLLPDLADWAAEASDRLPFVLAVIDREGADVSAYDGWHGEAEMRDVEGETHHLHKVPGGGWSHRRYQQTTEDAWHANASEVAEEVVGLVKAHRPRVVLLSGEPGMRADVAEQVAATLPVDSPTAVHQLESGARSEGASTEALWTEVRAVLDAERVADEQRLVERVARARAHDAAAIGVRETLAALAESRVETLLIASGRHPHEEVRVDDHPGLRLPDHPAAEDVLPGDLAVVAAACLTDASIEGVTPELLADLPGADWCAALLRWEEPVSPA